MTLEFAEVTHVVPNDQRGYVQEFLEKEIDDDADVKSAAMNPDRNVGLARVIEGWHHDSQGLHLTVEVWINGTHLHTAHVYPTGQITAYS